MQTTRPSLSKYVCGMVASLIIFLAGGWLILAPFALGYQPYGADRAGHTTNSFVVGSLRASAVLVAPTRVVAQASVSYQAQAAMPQATAQTQSDLDKTLATLAAALAADLSARRQGGSDQQNDQAQSMVNRSDAI